MITVRNLQESIYKDCYFSESRGKLTVNNITDTVAGTLSYVDFLTHGRFINVSNTILQDSREIYKAEDRKSGDFSYRKDCDGVCLLEASGRKFLLLIELKSGFNEIKKKGFEQIVASYVKIRGILQSIDGYNPADYEEIGLFVSYPAEGRKTDPATSLIEVKQNMIKPSALDVLNSTYATRLRVDNEVILNVNDYNLSHHHVNPKLYNPTLYIKHISVQDQVSFGTINIDKVL